MDFAFTEEQIMFKEQVIKFAKKEIVPRVQEHDLKSEFDFQAFRKLGEFGILGLHFPESFGGSEADVVTTVLAGEALGEAGVDGGLTLAYGAHSFLCADTIFAHGNDLQRKRYIPRLASGEWIGCMGMTEPGAGSDVASITTRADKRGDRYLLNGNKMFITNGPVADVAVVYAKTGKDLKHAGISAFVVEKGTPGFSAGKNLIKMGVRSSHTSELVF
jgi:alkylation response protein AidB-like acyl-CoA dehydrogenase